MALLKDTDNYAQCSALGRAAEESPAGAGGPRLVCIKVGGFAHIPATQHACSKPAARHVAEALVTDEGEEGSQPGALP